MQSNSRHGSSWFGFRRFPQKVLCSCWIRVHFPCFLVKLWYIITKNASIFLSFPIIFLHLQWGSWWGRYNLTFSPILCPGLASEVRGSDSSNPVLGSQQHGENKSLYKKKDHQRANEHQTAVYVDGIPGTCRYEPIFEILAWQFEIEVISFANRPEVKRKALIHPTEA